MDAMSLSRLRRQVAVRIALFPPLMILLLFLPAGTLAFWEGWVYLGVLFLPVVYAAVWLLKYRPELAERRMRMKEQEVRQGWIQIASGLVMLAAFILPGFDHRFGWSDVPMPLVLAANAVVLASYLIVLRVLHVNEYASRVVEVTDDQQVIDTGPYAMVRHPMYLGVLGMILATPLALGSYWALIPAALIVPALALRSVTEEEVLRRDLPGYEAYTQKVRHRLLPGIW